MKFILRRYEVWFLRLGLADHTGAWWFRYLLMNLGKAGCGEQPQRRPVQVWAAWFPRGEPSRHWIQGFPADQLKLSPRHHSPFYFAVGDNSIDDRSCRGRLAVGGDEITWELNYRSRWSITLSNKGWIGFSKTACSDARFSGAIRLNGRSFNGEPLAWGVQGHNCGFRHRRFWTWTHAVFHHADESLSTFEALVYEMPLGLVFAKAILFHGGDKIVFRRFSNEMRDCQSLSWLFQATASDGTRIEATIDGSGLCVHRLPYVKTDCSGTFEVSNNSLADARLVLTRPSGEQLRLQTVGGAVLEMAGEP